jgi:hypothetical protein
MSYDLAVFDVEVAPRDVDAFYRWFEEQAARDGSGELGPGSGEQGVASPRLASWLAEMTREFPSMSDSLTADEARAGDYSIGPALIYVAFGWSQADRAARRAVGLAAKHGVGFFDVSGDGEPIWSGDALRLKSAELAEVAEEEVDTEARGGGVAGYRRSNAKLRWVVTVLAGVSIAICVLLWTGAMSAPEGTSPVVGKVVMMAGAAFWSALTVGSWMEWVRTRRMWGELDE